MGYHSGIYIQKHVGTNRDSVCRDVNKKQNSLCKICGLNGDASASTLQDNDLVALLVTVLVLTVLFSK